MKKMSGVEWGIVLAIVAVGGYAAYQWMKEQEKGPSNKQTTNPATKFYEDLANLHLKDALYDLGDVGKVWGQEVYEHVLDPAADFPANAYQWIQENIYAPIEDIFDGSPANPGFINPSSTGGARDGKGRAWVAM
jgi:hypothetical protein